MHRVLGSPAILRPFSLAACLLAGCLACAAERSTQAPAGDTAQAAPLGAGLHVEVLGLHVRARNAALSEGAAASPSFIRLVGGDAERAQEILDGLRDSAFMLDSARCSTSNPAASVELLAQTEGLVLYAVVLALMYEFERYESSTGMQSLAVLHRLAERIESTDTLFPSRELLTPEEVAMTRGRRRKSGEREAGDSAGELFVVYVAELFESSTSNRELAVKKQRISQRIAALSDAVSVLYVRERNEQAQLCPAVDVLADATQDAWLWASEYDADRPAAREGYAYELELALTNVGAREQLAVLPRVTLHARDAQGQRRQVLLEPAQLREPGLSDNHVGPGFTLTRSLVGSSAVAPASDCHLELSLSEGRGVEPFELALASCGVEGHGD